jgi:hypothetical protein
MEIHHQFLIDKHKLFVEALRHRESGVLQHVVLLGAALSGFAWLLKNNGQCEPVSSFTIGTVAVLFLLTLGAIYCYVSSFNYRCFLLQVAKLERYAHAERYILKQWHPNKISNKIYGKSLHWWWFGPDIINVFWWSFLLAAIGVIGSYYYVSKNNCSHCWAIVFSLCIIFLNVLVVCTYQRKWKIVHKGETSG